MNHKRFECGRKTWNGDGTIVSYYFAGGWAPMADIIVANGKAVGALKVLDKPKYEQMKRDVMVEVLRQSCN
jgi:hypothetical protein